MNFAINKTNHVELEAAKEKLQKLVKQWTVFIESNAHAIDEINALTDEAKREVEQRMIKEIDGCLPNAPAKDIVQGILHKDASPYKEYTDKSSKDWIRDISNTVIVLHKERYQSELDELISKLRKPGNLGQYFFMVQDVQLTTNMVTPIAVDHDHTSQLIAKVQLNIDRSIKTVEEDKVGLNDHLNDCIPPYVAKLHALTHVDIANEYVNVSGTYEAEHHVQVMNKLHIILSAFS